MLRGGRHHLLGRRQHRLHHGHRLPAEQRRRCAVHGGLRARGQGGLEAFLACADELAAAYGDRFRPTGHLRELAASGETFPA
ncbi:MAG: hypothetical protein AVDCRST_MAG60-222 [uncultured Nocardioides sp.]|uniref:Uncharacterized protein n=1 Tax=uncultured Nocardioides sp. TaxID=198441 RepID=A0A6J4MYX3_9ACTN|nr:MAG: hypothetical protein AVDCRST_MAG60-222 [uncultured Nocardioides sp.]